jgi:7,8-dihydro-6-hydroxymethylpterin-pyrophosphokinase
LNESEAQTLAEIKAVLKRMKQAELDWQKEQSERENPSTIDPTSPSPSKTIKEIH